MSGSNRDLVGKCGAYCGSCKIYKAAHDSDEKAIFDMSFATRCTIDQIRCEGCGSKDRFPLTKGCIYRKCAKGRGLEACAFCQEYPCESISEYYAEVLDGDKEHLENSARMKEAGIDVWLDDMDVKWRCKHCDSKIAKGAKVCRICSCLIDPE